MKKKVQNIPPFDDFLSLSKQNFNNARLLIFHGISGSGKSSNLNYLAHHHPSFQNQSVKWIWTHHKRFKVQAIHGYNLVVVDEIVSPFQLPAIFKLLTQNKKIAVSSHLNPSWFRILCPFTPTLSFRTDASAEKIRRYLSKKDISFSSESILSFCKSYGSNYVDLQCILENHPGKSFDDALQWNRKFNKIKSFTPKKWIPKLPQLKFD